MQVALRAQCALHVPLWVLLPSDACDSLDARIEGQSVREVDAGPVRSIIMALSVLSMWMMMHGLAVAGPLR